MEGFQDLGESQRSRTPATHALVFMVRGATRKWKQVIGYFLYTNTIPCQVLRDLVFDAIRFCAEAELRLIAIVCDQETTQMRLWRELSVTTDSPYTPSIHEPQTRHQIAILPDPPHLLKNMRNNLMRYNIEVRNFGGW